jgi:hypothetical protein
VAKLTPATLTDTSARGDGVKVDEKGEIHLVRAWTVDGADNATVTSRTWETYSTWAPTDLVNPSKPIQSGTTAVTKAYYPIGENNTIWVQAKNAGVILAAKDGTALENVVPVNAVDTAASGKVQGVWKVPVTGNIDTESFIKLATIGVTDSRKVELTESLTTTAATDWLTVGGVEFDKTYGDKVTVTASWKAADGRTEEIAIAAQQIVVDNAANPTKMKFQVKLTSDTALEYDSSEAVAGLGTITLTVTAPGNNPIEIAIPVSIKLGAP